MAVVGEALRRSLPDSAAQQLHVLAVDDSIIDRKVIERLLKVSSCKVTAVDSGTSALQYLGLDLDGGGEKKSSTVGFDFLGHSQGLKVNLIMTDYSMPGMTGFELLKKVKESSALREIPVVIMSSENVMARIDRCLEEGAEEFIMKPVKLSDVKRLKDSVMRSEVEENKEKKTRKRKLLEDDGPSVSPHSTSQPSNSDPSSSDRSSPQPSSSDPLSPQPSHSDPSSSEDSSYSTDCRSKQPRLCTRC